MATAQARFQEGTADSDLLFLDRNGKTVFKMDTTPEGGRAANYLTSYASADGSAVKFKAEGLSENISIDLVPKGSGTVTHGGAASGDVVGPASATANAIPYHDGTTGKLLKASNVTIDDAGNNIAVPGTVSAATPTDNTHLATKLYVDNATAGAGDVVGPASATNLAIPVWDGTTGKLLKQPATTSGQHPTISANGDIVLGSGAYVRTVRIDPATGNTLGISFSGAADTSVFSATEYDINVPLDITDTTASTTTTTGALKVAGGAGIAGALNVGSDAKVTGLLTALRGAGSGSTTANGMAGLFGPTGAGDLMAVGNIAGKACITAVTSAAAAAGADVYVNLSSAAATRIGGGSCVFESTTLVSALNTTDATSSTAASLKTAGGLAVAKKIWAGTGGIVSNSGISFDSGTNTLSNYVATASWTPTLTATVNLDGNPTASAAQYERIGGVIFWRMQVSADPTTGSGDTQFTFTLPVNLSGARTQRIGDIIDNSGAVTTAVFTNASASVATAKFGASGTGAETIYLSGSYLIA